MCEWTYIRRINQFTWMNRHSKNRLLVLNELVDASRLYRINEYMEKVVSFKNELSSSNQSQDVTERYKN